MRPATGVLDLNLRSLEIFVQIAETGGMSPAARRMGLTQSAVSQMVANLEESLHVTLFDRQVRPIALTPSGVILLDKARLLLRSARDAIMSVREPAATAFPKLNLCLVETVTGLIGAELVKSIQGLAEIWSVQTGLHSQHSRALLAREADIVLTCDELEDHAGVERHEIFKELFLIAVPKSFAGETHSLQALAAKHELIRFSGRTMLGRQVERHLRRLRIDAKGRVELDNADTILAMVGCGLGWAMITPLCALLGQEFWPEVRFMAMPGPALYRRLYVIARQGELGDIPNRIANAASACIKESVQTHFADYPWIVAGCTLPAVRTAP
jgi:DNA-binding transcriptional LysR family regulator